MVEVSFERLMSDLLHRRCNVYAQKCSGAAPQRRPKETMTPVTAMSGVRSAARSKKQHTRQENYRIQAEQPVSPVPYAGRMRQHGMLITVMHTATMVADVGKM
jgi:hypothetical protein